MRDFVPAVCFTSRSLKYIIKLCFVSFQALYLLFPECAV